MSFLSVRREGDTLNLEHRFYGRFKFNAGAALADASAASAQVFAGERTDGCATAGAAYATSALTRASGRQPPARVAIKLDSGNQVYSDHLFWRDLYYSDARFAGLPWILSHTLPEVPWGDGTTDMMVSELLGNSLEAVRLRSATVRLA